jgi:hypothetical protein
MGGGMSITLDGTSGITAPAVDVATPFNFNDLPAEGKLTLDTAQASTSGTSIDFTGIPSWVKRLTLIFDGVSVSGADHLWVQIGSSGGIETTGYAGTRVQVGASTAAGTATAAIPINSTGNGDIHNGHLTFTRLTPSSNTWIASGVIAREGSGIISISGGKKTLSDTLDRIRLTTAGTNTFDAGTINIMYE